MSNPESSPLSRRHWLGLVSTASVGSGLLAAATGAPAAEPPAADPGSLGTRIYNIRDFGARGDGQTLDTAALQSAIDACHRDQGGTVLVPAGVFVIGTVELKSNVTLHLAAQGKLLGTADGRQYHAANDVPLSGDSTLGDGNTGLIFAVKAENITIEGAGTIDGQGAQFRSAVRGEPPPSGIGGAHRPYHLMLYQCQNVVVRGLRLVNGAFHSLRIVQCRYARFDGIHIHNRVNHNNDGFHFISCDYVHVVNCDVQCQDDACALFGSCKFVTITNSSFSTRWSVFRFGGGIAENITVSNCLIYETFGCPIKMRCGPDSRFENISFSNLVMTNVTGPISIGVGRQRRRGGGGAGGGGSTTNSLQLAEMPESAKPGIVRNISFSGIHAVVAKPTQFADVGFISGYNPGEMFSAIILNGTGEGVLENISFDDVHVTFPGGGTAEQGAVRDVPRVAGEYYEIGVPPAYGMYARNVQGLTLQNVRFQVAAPDLRPAVIFDHVQDALVNGMSVQGDRKAESVMRFIGARDVLLAATRVLGQGSAFLQVEGADSSGIKIDGGDLSKATAPLAFKAGAAQSAVKWRE